MTTDQHLRYQRDTDIDVFRHPRGHRGIARRRARGGQGGATRQTRLTMYLDNAVVEFFKARAGTRGYQTLINEALKHAIEHEGLEDTLRRVIREETATYKVRGKT